LPACNVPWDFDSLGLPFSVQLTGAARTESHVLGLAGELHRLGRHPVTLQPNV
jgi:Asp-tRNA(Asn)/Glu-tRNA(Gln) amidotransferase A subunit family amidase